MWLYRFLLAILGGSCLVILSAALARTAASVAPAPAASPFAEALPVPPAPAPREDAAAERCLEQALEALKPERVHWLETTIRQKVQLPGYAYEADGSYHLAPGQRFRMEMHTRCGETESTLLMVSDGRALWQGDRSGDGVWENVTRLNLSEVFGHEVMNGPAGPRLRSEFLQRPHFQGMTPLLRNLRSRLVWARREVLHRAGEEQIRLVGVWPKKEVAKLAPPDEAWPIGLPRQCHLYLDARTYWPQRVEWWGPSDGAERLLVQMEFRNPVFNRPLPVDVCARLFTFQPGNVEVHDETASVTAEMSHRAAELALRSAAR
jgi:hypothetical protein